jgi:UDP-N-acetylmuramoyl-tripeptide--D-alanyl-D-alanine ligase
MKVDGLTLRFVRNSTKGTVYGTERRITGVSIDSRTVKRGELFFAIKGENFDGHAFCSEALRRGASYVVAEKDCGVKDHVIRVESTLDALGNLASRWRRRFSIRCIGITGTSGKTTTRRIIAHLLKRRYSCIESLKNYNNMIGLPLSVLQIDENTEVAVIEIAMNRKGEIERLAKIADPDVGVVTNIGRGHLEFLGSVENVSRAKAELLQHLGSGDVAVLNCDDKNVRRIRRRTKATPITYGVNRSADFRAHDIQTGQNGSVFSVNGVRGFTLQLLGRMNVYNGLAGIATASFFGCDSREMKERLKSVGPMSLRLNRISVGGVTVINDSYNANPDSMAEAIGIVSQLAGNRKIACIGDMLELGKYSLSSHREVGRMLVREGFDVLLLYGPFSRYIKRSAKECGFKGVVVHFTDREKLNKRLKKVVRRGDIVLIKGSHNNRLDIVAEDLITYLKGKE